MRSQNSKQGLGVADVEVEDKLETDDSVLELTLLNVDAVLVVDERLVVVDSEVEVEVVSIDEAEVDVVVTVVVCSKL